ncbi:MAG TPA: hypothetical protein VE441_04605, partial [Mycobacterium sp.]|nr:hypothetical protein [Mycobacterium sp.]
MANLTPVAITSDGSQALTLAAATGGGDTVINVTSARQVFLLVNNGGGSPITVTLTSVVACNQGVTHNPTFSVTNGTQKPIPIPGQCINTSGQVAIAYSAVTSVT